MATPSNETIITITITCLCGASKQVLQLQTTGHELQEAAIRLCHCDTCRHSTGMLFTSYLPLSQPPGSLDGLVKYDSSSSSARYFCSTCGCHVFRSRDADLQEEVKWEVATGVIATSPSSSSSSSSPLLSFFSPSSSSPTTTSSLPWTHQHVDDTLDGGLSIFLGNDIPATSAKNNNNTSQEVPPQEEQELPASCNCGAIRFRITRPSAASTAPHSRFPDLTHAYATTTPPETLANPADEKWWLRSSSSPSSPSTSESKKSTRLKYLAGTCACRSCRLISGFEVQVWAFVPRANILVVVPVPGTSAAGVTTTKPLEFSSSTAIATTPPHMRSYNSSGSVVREFCDVCGATVFWHDGTRPELIDVSAGLLRSVEGARAADSWLEWWTGRVSFAEKVEEEREGVIAAWARRLVEDLESGLKASEGRN